MRKGPKEKRERSLGERLGLKGERCASPKCAAVRKPYKPGAHGQSRRRKALSEFGKQIQEKQKFKVSYGVNERWLRKSFEEASKTKGSTSAKLVEFLERRLDNVVYRIGFANSRSRARQLIVHGHVYVNDKRVKSPGMLVKVGNVVGFRPASKSDAIIKDLPTTLKKFDPPAWLALRPEQLEGQVLALPSDATPAFEINLLVESFSK